MLFNSGIFALFFALFFPLYLLVRQNVFWRNVLLIVASYLFYGWWDARFLILVAISTSVDYMAALGAAGKPVFAGDRLKSAAFLLVVTGTCLAFASRKDVWLMPLVVAGILLAAVWLKSSTTRLPNGSASTGCTCLCLRISAFLPSSSISISLSVRSRRPVEPGNRGRAYFALHHSAGWPFFLYFPGDQPNHGLVSWQVRSRPIDRQLRGVPRVLSSARCRAHRARRASHAAVRERQTSQSQPDHDRGFAVCVGSVSEDGNRGQRRADRQCRVLRS